MYFLNLKVRKCPERARCQKDYIGGEKEADLSAIAPEFCLHFVRKRGIPGIQCGSTVSTSGLFLTHLCLVESSSFPDGFISSVRGV